MYKIRITKSIIYILFIIYFIVPHHLFLIMFGVKNIKPTDIISIALAAILIMKIKIKINRNWNYAYIFLACIYLIYGIINLFLGINETFLYSVKITQYALVILAINHLNYCELKSILKITIIFSIFWGVLEILGVKTGIGWAGRLSGQFGGPYEFSAVLVLGILFLDESRKIKILEIILLYLTNTKASILSLVVGIVLKKRILYLKNIMLLSILIGVIVAYDERFQIFYKEAINILSLENIILLFNIIPTVNTNEDYMRIWELRENIINNMELVDLSTGSRLYTYLLFIKTINFSSLIFGNGPGFYGPALDSSVLRLFGELGLIGIYAGYVVINGISKSLPIKNPLLFLFVLMSLSDIFYSAKFFIYLVMLSVYLEKKEINEKNSYSK